MTELTKENFQKLAAEEVAKGPDRVRQIAKKLRVGPHVVHSWGEGRSKPSVWVQGLFLLELKAFREKLAKESPETPETSPEKT